LVSKFPLKKGVYLAYFASKKFSRLFSSLKKYFDSDLKIIGINPIDLDYSRVIYGLSNLLIKKQLYLLQTSYRK
tara:strand:+ start:358 stop:579 length:222 start_codon:yes stop_codon:yes gene_type:complete